jgi:hypothetical protein
MRPELFLTLAETVERIRSGQPITWLTVRDVSGTYDVAIAHGNHQQITEEDKDAAAG